MNNTHLDRFIRDLHQKPQLREQLRNDADGLAQRYNVSAADIEAVKQDDTEMLVARGMDPRLTSDPVPRLRDKAWRIASRAGAGVALAVLGFAVFVPAGHASGRLGLRRARFRSGRHLVRGRQSVRHALRRARCRVSERASHVSKSTLLRVRARVIGDVKYPDPILDPNSGSKISVQDPIAK